MECKNKREDSLENENQINVIPEGNPEQSTQQCPGRRPGTSGPYNDNTRIVFPALL